MAWKVLRQKDGKYSIYSTVVDDLICRDYTKKQLEKVFVEEAKNNAKQNFTLMINRLHNIALDNEEFWNRRNEDIIETVKYVHGNRKSKEVEKCLKGN